MRKSGLFLASSFLALAAAGNAFAQDQSNVEQVEVSASRITVAGYTQPTPVTVVGEAELERAAKPDIGDAIRDLPAVGSSYSASNGQGAGNIASGWSGLDTVNLRNLGTNRTLVLFDGQRVVSSILLGWTDLSTIPTSLVKRVDVVTGGASAVWGSDAVAGVVNLVLDKDFTGFKANVQGGTNFNYQTSNYKYEGSFGTDFDGGRGHFILSGAYNASPDVYFQRQSDWYGQYALFNNPAYAAGNGQPRLITRLATLPATPGGVITSSAAGPGAAANAFRGIQFTGSGTPAPFNFGTTSGQVSYGGDGSTSYADVAGLTSGNWNATVFGYGSYKITPAIKASIQLNYGRSYAVNNTIPFGKFGTTQTMQADNAFLNPTIAAQMQTAGVKTFTLATTGMFGYPYNNYSNLSISAQEGSLIPVGVQRRQLTRGVFTLEGTLGNDWSWNTYYQHGETRIDVKTVNNIILSNYNKAIDAVQVTAANRGTSGLPIGSIACRTTLTSPGNGCQPLDLFGDNAPSAASMNYVKQGSNSNWEDTVLNEDVVEGSMQGTLPWELPAGKVAVAFGAGYRKEGGRTRVDALSMQGFTTGVSQYPVGNFSPFAGQYNVEEGFLEVDAPLLKDTFVQSLDLNMAGRMTSYSTSGLVETYKLGLTSQVIDDVRLRFTYSSDIRAPNLSELFSQGSTIANTFADPYHPGQSLQGYTTSRGNPNLQPEVATTLSGGVVYTPAWIDGLSVSLDWYSILIHNAIYTPGTAAVSQQCAMGNAVFCSLIYVGTGAGDATLTATSLNAAAETTSGLDFQADYATPFLQGDLAFRVVGNYTDEQTRRALGVLADGANSLDSTDSVAGFGGAPKFRATLEGTYSEGPYSFTVQTRLIGSAHLVNTWTSGVDVDNNDIPFFAYLDLRGSYKFNDDFNFYGAVDNVANTAPPFVPVTGSSNSQTTYFFPPTAGSYYSNLGRQYRIGLRFNY